MRAILMMLLAATTALATVGLWGCSDDDSTSSDADSDADADSDTDSDSDSDSDSDTDTDADSDTDADTDAMLDSSHDGWGNPECRSCHSDAHNPEMNIGECVDCHGKNGNPAVDPHGDCGGSNAGAGSCHSGVHGGAANGFPAGSCGPCHS